MGAQILVVPAALYLFFHPDLGAWSFWLTVAAYAILGLLGASGALLAILRRTGVVQFTYTDADKETPLYKVQTFAEDFERDVAREKESRERKAKGMRKE